MYFPSSLLNTAPQKSQTNIPNCSISPTFNAARVFSASRACTTTYSLIEFFCNKEFKMFSNSSTEPGKSNTEYLLMQIENTNF